MYTIISPAAVPDLTPEPELEDPRSAKRRRPAERQAESLILDPIPKSTPLPTPNGPDSRTRASNEPSPGPFDTDSKGDGAGCPVLPLNDLLDIENGGDSAHGRGIGEELLHSSRGLISPFEEIQGDQDMRPDSDRCEEKSNASDGEVGESYEDELNQIDDVSCGALVTTSRRREPSNRRFRKKGRGPLRSALRPRD